MSALAHKLRVLKRIVLKKTYKVLGGINRYLQPKSTYHIKAGYRHATSIEHYDATSSTDEFQPSVYELAATIAAEKSFQAVVDVGCGSAYKLVNRLGQYRTTGIETEPAYSWLKSTYPDRAWLKSEDVNPSAIRCDLLICCDVIEHIENPDSMMEFLQKINFEYLVLSTPERDQVAGVGDYGPPQNVFHYREWNAEEFKAYVSQWFIVEAQHIFPDKSITQTLVCRHRLKN